MNKLIISDAHVHKFCCNINKIKIDQSPFSGTLL